ncbi:uncharacterized protein LOC114861412 [Betta splendens]|uniref:Uncharacterized protein LOC114861412 n=1 Tax=Betta splendens TaxID=158456 RepID=A0A6P7NE28_BETSP|nr:uncharacterized protein LOC114861412 [Betta splendens]
MNPYGTTSLTSGPCDNPSSSSLVHPPVIQTGHSSAVNSTYRASNGGQQMVQSPNPDRFTLPLPATDSGFSLSPRSQFSLAPVSTQSHVPSPNPYPPLDAPPTCQISVILPSPEPRPPLTAQCSEESCPDLECSICFSQFNNIFRCPKMLHCKHTFCLECLARINVKSTEPSAIQCPLCRSFTPLPSLGLPKLTTDPDVLSFLPAAMQRVYSIRFLRSKGKLEVKRAHEGGHRWGQRSLSSLRSGNRSLDVGLPSPPLGGRRSEAGGVGGALFSLTGRPACRAFLLTSVVMMMMLLTGVIIFLITHSKT